jgi:hypothetical protein
MQEDASYPDLYRLLAACYAHKGRLDDTREIVMRLRAITPVEMPSVGHLRDAAHRDLSSRACVWRLGGEMTPVPRFLPTIGEVSTIFHLIVGT